MNQFPKLQGVCLPLHHHSEENRKMAILLSLKNMISRALFTIFLVSCTTEILTQWRRSKLNVKTTQAQNQITNCLKLNIYLSYNWFYFAILLRTFYEECFKRLALLHLKQRDWISPEIKDCEECRDSKDRACEI